MNNVVGSQANVLVRISFKIGEKLSLLLKVFETEKYTRQLYTTLQQFEPYTSAPKVKVH